MYGWGRVSGYGGAVVGCWWCAIEVGRCKCDGAQADLRIDVPRPVEPYRIVQYWVNRCAVWGRWGGVNGHGVGRRSTGEHGAGGVNCYVTGIEVDGRSGGGARVRCANGVDGDVTVDGVDWFGLHGVVRDGIEAWGIADLCCPVEPRGIGQYRVEHGAGCR